MERLIASQRELHGRIARTCENLRKAGTAKVTVDLVKSTLAVLDAKWLKFETQHDRLQLEYGESLEKNDYQTTDFVSLVESTYLQQRVKLLEYERTLGGTSVVEEEKSRPARATAVAARSVLPRIQLPQFSGKFEDWPAFRDLFRSIVVGEPTLSKVEKLHYLKTSLTGDAEQLIRNLPSTEENFERAWATLTDHFENKRLLVRSYLTALTALSKMKSDSAADLRRIFHGVVSTVGALEGIGRPVTNGSDLFVHLVVELLDSKTRREWENAQGRCSEPASYEELRDFLQEQLMTQEALQPARGDSTPGKSSRSARANHARGRGAESSRSCPICKKEHFLAFCDQYKKKAAAERKEAVSANNRCLNCLGRHLIGECQSTKVCGKCSGRHHTSLHEAFASVTVAATAPSTSATVHVAKQPVVEEAAVMLATARVLIMDRAGVHHPVRVLIDPGSEVALIAESLVQRLRLPRAPTSVNIFGVGGVRTGHSRGRVSVTLSSNSGSYTLPVSPVVLPRLSLYNCSVRENVKAWSHISGIELADPRFSARDPIDLLLGAAAYASILLPGLRRGGPLEPVAQQTQLGWILFGAVDDAQAPSSTLSLRCSAEEEISTLLRRFWEWEEPPQAALPLSDEDRECEGHFARTHQRSGDGRYQVRLCLRSEVPDLSSTRRTSTRMLEAMERRFARDTSFADRYRAFMSEYRALGHMSLLDASSSPAPRVCYLPHHGVLKTLGSETKIRVVFNGSSRTVAGACLNDSLLTGPNLLPMLADVITRWRCHQYVFTADVEKMYRQVLVHPEDRHLQRILWKENGEVSEYCLNTITYGLASAPYLAIRALHQLAMDEEQRFPQGAEALRRDVYMDDILTGAADLEACQGLCAQMSSLCMAGGFPLRKWAANHRAILDGVPLDHQLSSTADASLPSCEHSVLGLRWSPDTDKFALTVRQSESAPPTKRRILSQISRLFDPLGWVSPIVVRAKLILQSTWLQHLEWDNPLGTEESTAWLTVERELALLERIRLPRWFRYDTSTDLVELHGFSDASERAYAAVVYLRVARSGRPHISLVMAKTKVAPLKQISLPRLELCAAALLAKLASHLRSALRLGSSAVVLWTDSTVTLAWIRGHPTKWNTFVANRVAEIQRLSEDAMWRHVPGRENPADCASRGILPGELLDHPLWWQGPAFLREAPDQWPTESRHSDPDGLPEQRAVRCLATPKGHEPEELRRFSSLR